jgi:2-polyprenyl-3-methyl-5-hydroxy-6-metoxy-1,4-benzoquinol methylase
VKIDTSAAWKAWRSYAGHGAVTQAFLLGRMAVAPLGPLDPEFRALRGRVLSLGCGHGVVDRYLALINPDVTIEGVDLDAERIAVANATADRVPRFTAKVADVTTLDPQDAYDAALCVDILHHVPFGEHARIASALHRCLRPGGSCLVKEMAATPRRQYLWNRLHDRLSAGPEPIHCRDPEDLAAVLSGVGFEITAVRRLKRLGLYPQYLVLATKP